MPTNKEAARVLAHPNGQKREIAQPRVFIVHQMRRTCKVLAAKLALTACAASPPWLRSSAWLRVPGNLLPPT